MFPITAFEHWFWTFYREYRKKKIKKGDNVRSRCSSFNETSYCTMAKKTLPDDLTGGLENFQSSSMS